MSNKFCVLYYLSYSFYQLFLLCLSSTLETPFLNSSEVVNRTEFGNNGTEPTEEPTFFEKLDQAIYESLNHPQPGTADKLFADIEMFRNCLRRVRRMYMEMEGEKIECLRNSVVRLYTAKGGPTFTRFSPFDSENKQKLLDVFKWSEDDLKRLYRLQEESENIWYTVKNIVI